MRHRKGDSYNPAARIRTDFTGCSGRLCRTLKLRCDSGAQPRLFKKARRRPDRSATSLVTTATGSPLTERSLFRRAGEIIGAIIAGEDEAEILQTSVGNALLMIREAMYDTENVAIEYSVSLLRVDRYTAAVISIRKS